MLSPHPLLSLFLPLPPDYGFDPLRLGSKDKDVLKYYREGELTNGRWAMAAVAGILFTDLVRGGLVVWIKMDVCVCDGDGCVYQMDVCV